MGRQIFNFVRSSDPLNGNLHKEGAFLVSVKHQMVEDLYE
jgi:hypothetical protein